MLNAGFQYLEQRDANDIITKNGVVGKNSPFSAPDNSGIYDVIAEDLRWLKENIDDVKDTSDLEAIKQSVTDMYNTMKNDSSFGEATAKAQAEEAKKQAQAALESATKAKTYYDDITAKSTEVNDTIAEIKSYIEKAEALNESNKELEQSISDSATVATNKAKSAANSATNAATSETNAKASETKAKASETNAKVSETNAAKSESNAKSHMDATATSEAHAKTSETNAKASQIASKTSENNAKTSETNAKQYSINSSNSADLAKAWAESSDSPDSVNDTDSTTGKTQSAKTWAIYSKDRAISAFTSETHAKTSETNAKASETNAANSATNSASSATASTNSAKAAATSATNAKTSETNAATSASNAKTSEANAKTSETNSANSAQSSSDSSDLSKAWSVSTTSPDNIADKDSPTSKTQSSRTWALYSRDRAISAFKSETNAKASETASKTSETNAADSASRAKASETSASTSASNAATSASNAKTSETNAKASETNASASKTDAATSETNAKSYMATAKEYMQKAQEALAAAQAIQSLIDTSKANAEKCLADVEAVKESLAKMITYQGSVDNYSDLPTNPQVGYSYNVKNADKTHGVNAGDNLVWNGTDWDNFGSYVDMSLFAELGKDVKFNSVTATLNGNAATATKLATARTIALSGNAIGSTTFDGSGNATINTTVNESAHAAKATQDTNGRAFTDTNAYMHISTLANGTDFNNVKTTGVYTCIEDNYPNRPRSSWGVLRVYNFGNVKQEYIPDNTYEVWERYFSGSWSAWSKVAASTADTCTGNAATASKLLTPRTISLTGKAAGSTSFDGSTNASINVTSVNADTASKLNTVGGGTTTFNWVGKAGQPNWLWGGNNSAPTEQYVYNPSNFHVSSANTATSATTAGNVSNKIYYSSDSPSVATDKLFTVKQAHAGDDNVPNNGLVIQSGPTGANYNGKLYLTDNGGDGVWVGGVAAGKEVGWKRLVENWGSWNINAATATNATKANTANALNNGQAGSITVNQSGYSDYSPTVGGNYANMNISSWFGVSFTSQCGGSVPKGKTAVGIDCREGIVRARRFEGALNGNASTTTKLQTPRTISLTGNASGSATFDGSGNVSINTTVSNSDMVDGVHAGSMYYNKGNWAADNWATMGAYQVNNISITGGAYGWGQVISSSTADSRFQLYATHQYGGDGRLHYRTGWDNDKGQPWNTILDSENYNHYAPTKTGTGATGTWPISVSGNAATATKATSATTAATCTGNSATATKATTALNIPTSDVGGNIWIS